MLISQTSKAFFYHGTSSSPLQPAFEHKQHSNVSKVPLRFPEFFK